MNIVFRADASCQLGIGHVMRCLTLAKELSRNGCEVLFVCRAIAGDMREYIAQKGFQLSSISLPEGHPYAWEEDASQSKERILKWGRPVDWLVVDHYQLDERWEGRVRRHTDHLMAIDDLANRRHACDLLLDQNYYTNMKARYDGLVPDDCVLLLGPEYVLLREEFRKESLGKRERDGHISNVLVFFGGGDADNLTMRAVRAIAHLSVSGIYADVVVGMSNPLRNAIARACESIPNITFHCQTERMAELIEKADICLGAGGISTWERAVLGLPSVTVVCAENQFETTRDMANMGAIRYIGRAENVYEQQLSDALNELIKHPSDVKSMGIRAKSLMGKMTILPGRNNQVTECLLSSMRRNHGQRK